LQYAGKTHLPAIWHSVGRSNLLAEVEDDGVPSDFVLGMTLAIYKILLNKLISCKCHPEGA